MPRPEAGGAARFLDGELVIAGGTTWDGDTKLWLKMSRYISPEERVAIRTARPFHGVWPFVHSRTGSKFSAGLTAGKSIAVMEADRSKSKWHATGLSSRSLLTARRASATGVILGGCPTSPISAGCSDSVWRRDGGPWRRVSSLPGGPLALPPSPSPRRIYVRRLLVPAGSGPL
jgi:hypothetical protein